MKKNILAHAVFSKSILTALLLVSTFTYTVEVFAYQFSGAILKNADENVYNLQINASLVYPLDSIYPVIRQQMNRLNTADYISFNGHMSDISSLPTIMIDSIDYVGLKALLGTWKSNTNQCFYFKTHTSFYVKPIDETTKTCPPMNKDELDPSNTDFVYNQKPTYYPNKLIESLELRIQKLKRKKSFSEIPFKKDRYLTPDDAYTYFINPDVDDWNMLITSNNSEFIGELKLVSLNHINIQLFDSKTDANLGVIELRK